MMKQTMLIPLDGSDFARQIIPYVRLHFRPDCYTLKLLHVADLPAEAREGVPFAILMKEAADMAGDNEASLAFKQWSAEQGQARAEDIAQLKEHLERDVRKLMLADYTVSAEVGFGKPAKEIVAFAEHGVNLIAMATHGRTGLDHVLMGSVAEQVIRHVHVPVFLIRPGAMKT